jgi:hypothetical protein
MAMPNTMRQARRTPEPNSKAQSASPARSCWPTPRQWLPIWNRDVIAGFGSSALLCLFMFRRRDKHENLVINQGLLEILPALRLAWISFGRYRILLLKG